MSNNEKKRWTNDQWDSTITLAGVVITYCILSIGAGVLAWLNEKGVVPPGVLQVYQGSKELMLLVAGYFFGKKRQLEQNGNGNGEPQP